MDMLEFEKNRRKKKENVAVNHINVNSSINKQDFINYNPLENIFKSTNMAPGLENSTIDPKITNLDTASTVRQPDRLVGTAKNEGTAKFEGSTKREGPFDNEGATRFEGTSKMKAPNKIKIDLNSIERVRVSLDSLRIEQIVKQVVNGSHVEEVVIGRRVFENNGVNTSRFTSAREETRDRGIIEFEKRKDKNGIEHTWYKLK